MCSSRQHSRSGNALILSVVSMTNNIWSFSLKRDLFPSGISNAVNCAHILQEGFDKSVTKWSNLCKRLRVIRGENGEILTP